MNLTDLEQLIARKLEQARHSNLIHLTLTQAADALKAGFHTETTRLVNVANELEQELATKLGVAAPAPGLLPMIESIAEQLAGRFVTPQALEEFKGELATWIDQQRQGLMNAVGNMLTAHVVELERRFPVAAATLKEVAQQVGEAAHLANAASAPSSPAGVQWPPLPTDPFPTPEQFAALGFYPDTYEHQKAAWEASKAPSAPAAPEPAPAGTATPEASSPATTDPTATPKTTAENAPTDAATGASSGSA
jgi:hypothetical protein